MQIRQPHVEHVGRAGFADALTTLRAVVKDASFVAFDTELSGLSSKLERPSLMDTVAERYAQVRESAQSFAIVQFGLSCFTWRADARVFDVQTFQFPIFPMFPSDHNNGNNGNHNNSNNGGFPDRSFLVQAKCLAYIRDHGFDLNKWVDDGICYLSQDEQHALAHVLHKPLRDDVKAKFHGDTATNIRTQESDHFLKGMRKRIQKLIHRKGKHKSGSKDEDEDETPAAVAAAATRLLTHSIQDDDAGRSFLTEPLAPFRRSVLMAMAEKEFPHVIVLDCPVDNDNDAEIRASPWKRRLRVITTTAVTSAVDASDTNSTSDDEKQAYEMAYKEIIRKEHEAHNVSFIGFTALMDVLTDASNHTPIVGHNMLLDTMQCYDKFHGELPNSCSLFLHKLSEWLDGVCVFDTKVLVEHAMEQVHLFSEKLDHSALEHVYETISKGPFHGPALRDIHHTTNSTTTTTTTSSLSAHQAGYDAFMTGAVFLRVCSGLGVPNDAIGSIGKLSHLQPTGQTAATNGSQLPRWRQTLLDLRNVMMIHHLLPPTTLKLPGPFPLPVETSSRKKFLRASLTRVFHGKVKASHIQQCVAWALGLGSNSLVKIRHESKTSVFIQLPTEEHVEELLKIRLECQEVHGTATDPIPSLGCLDLTRCCDDSSEEAAESELVPVVVVAVVTVEPIPIPVAVLPVASELLPVEDQDPPPVMTTKRQKRAREEFEDEDGDN